jgi:hypothetical protein
VGRTLRLGVAPAYGDISGRIALLRHGIESAPCGVSPGCSKLPISILTGDAVSPTLRLQIWILPSVVESWRNIGKHIRLVQDISVWVSLHNLEQRIWAIWTEALPQVSDYDLHGIIEFLPWRSKARVNALG